MKTRGPAAAEVKPLGSKRDDLTDLDLEYGEVLSCECPECGANFAPTPGEIGACPTCGMVCDPCDPVACGQAE